MQFTQFTQISYVVDAPLATITLDRPERLNAWTPHMAAEQIAALDLANADPTVGAIVMTGAGRGFCSGADVRATLQASVDRGPRTRNAGDTAGMPIGRDWVELVRSSKPIVCAVNGAAVGVGVTMCLPADYIVAGSHARFGVSFIRMGLVPELAATRLLVDRVGFGRASELLLSGRIVDAATAGAIGLADEVVEADDLIDRACEVARTFASNPTRQLLMIKELLTHNAVESDLRLVQEREQLLLAQCATSPEHRESISAFIEKRDPDFEQFRTGPS